MTQDAPGRGYVRALWVWLVVVAGTAAAFIGRDRMPGARAVLVLGGAVVVVAGVAFLLYVAVLSLRRSSPRHKAEWEAYLAGLKEDERDRQTQELPEAPAAEPETPPRAEE